ncbi:thiamine pyrophosphate-dependent dehydrogenase E1 component subunit alpha [Pseudoalteromonas luteoviolacea]|uniref:Dehydrogenase E1 component domain-containing protein n=1 Tax=Pseudoalteromonas luteoviolacea S4054 TaxID=1129367 RepID=A0A0F6A743_9GAMM|nr:thiamine pyrophosphate-dependent dehydrogenase E1 component subunit alpha [Pseudoalteromonas luteoviolacea]AOT07467.1 hypothetical protein S4054249_06260 [Pseudoalteromonas luteoviolacea]AOT12383.1 hypothetical protein S40542_06260 [Pseudoalteromonas luteoviolacea]AOT17296.1 hypothetical protein S4054_06260 [Pseudoalteromonas luteoviolacea]KKE81980.1 hypothetical protein N479_20395 [Pseudoalteromonas luteoviolacea S4054]KZN74174.1 hypothetical protein N481_09340 [Pseudoalteromonas luteoviol
MADLKHIYFQTLRIRKIEEAIAAKYPEQKMRCPTHLSIGQELVPVAVSNFLTHSDKAYSSHRAHAHYLAKGGNLTKLIAELYGKVSGCTAGRGGSMHLSDLDCGFIASTAIVGNSIPLATGNALHQQLTHSEGLTISYFGDGATEEGAFYESLNFAALRSLPIVYVCENNQYSVYSPLSVRQPNNRSISKLSAEIGLKSFSVDGNNPTQALKVAQTAINHVRDHGKPVLVEYFTYRHREHCGPHFDDDLSYRNQEEVQAWLDNDPLTNLEKALDKDPEFSAFQKLAINEINQEIEQAFAAAETASFGLIEDNERFIYD